MPKAPQDLKKFESLLEIVASLRGPGGCPWDQEQNHKTLAPYAIEEVYEMVEAVEQADDLKTKEELGDVLFQVALHAQLARERKAFDMENILQTLNEKMVRRHPHVFSDVQVSGTEEVWENWEKIKRAEKSGSKKQIDIPENIPSLQRAYKIGVKTQKAGFDWSTPAEVLEKVKEEMKEVEVELSALKNADTGTGAGTSVGTGTPSEQRAKLLEAEIGDLLFSVAQLARHCGFEPEQTLRAANRKFLNRYEAMHEICKTKGLDFEKLNLAEKENLWLEVKKLR